MNDNGFAFAPSFEEISARAYQFFEDENRPEGKHEEHWRRAEKVLSEELRGRGGVPAQRPVEEQRQR